MDSVAAAFRQIHVIIGFIGLASFWVPVFTRKGGVNHVRFGTVFKWCAYFVLATAALSIAHRLVQLGSAGQGPSDEPRLYALMVFLGYLTLTTFVMVRHAIGVLRTKRNPGSLRTPLNLALAASSVAASIALIAYAAVMSPPNAILLYALSPIGIGTGIGMLRYLTGRSTDPRQWLYEHLGGMLGAGIAFHTAFAVFGSTRIFSFDLHGWVQVVPWVAPAMIGVPAIFLWQQYFRRKYSRA